MALRIYGGHEATPPPAGRKRRDPEPFRHSHAVRPPRSKRIGAKHGGRKRM